MKRKTIPSHCPGCGKQQTPATVSADAMEPFVQAYPCGECQNAVENAQEKQAWAEADHRILERMARENGEVITVLQKGGGEYETHRYVVDLFGLQEVPE